MFHNKIVSHLGVLERLLLLLLCLVLLQFKLRKFHPTNNYFSNLFYFTFSLICIIGTIIVLINWKMMCKACSRQIVKYSQTLDYFLETLLFPAVVILKMVLFMLEPVYKTCFNIKSQSKFSLVQYFWSLASKVFLSTIMIMCLFLFTVVSNVECGYNSTFGRGL